MWLNWGTYGLAGTSWRNLVDIIHDCVCWQCQARHFDLVNSTAFIDVGCTLLFSETPPSRVIGNQAICIYINQVLWFQLVSSFFFSSRAWSLHQPSLFATPDNKFPSLLIVTEVSYTGAEISLGTFPIFWLVVHLKKLTLFWTHHRPAATQIAAFCAVYIFRDAGEGCLDFPPALPKHALTCCTFYLVCL